MDRFWLKNYPPGVPADIDGNQYRSLGQLLENAFATAAALLAIILAVGPVSGASGANTFPAGRRAARHR